MLPLRDEHGDQVTAMQVSDKPMLTQFLMVSKLQPLYLTVASPADGWPTVANAEHYRTTDIYDPVGCTGM